MQTRRFRWCTLGAVALATAAAAAACADNFRGIAPTPAAAETQAGELFSAVADRYTTVDWAPRYDAARIKLAQSALVPSRVFGDSTIWSAWPMAGTRRLYASGTFSDGRYHLETRPSLTPAAKLGDTRHVITLQQLDPNAFRWDTDVDLAIGSITPAGMSVLISSILGAPDGQTERALRESYRAAMPRAVAAFGRGFSIDSLHVTPGGSGTTAVSVTFGFHPDEMRAAFPALAKYLDKYLGPAKYHFALSDHAGTALFDVVGRDRAMTLHYRVLQGKLTSLYGPPRSWADSLRLESDVSLKVKFFTVGFHKLVTDFVIGDAPHERAWTVIAQHEPDWDLPFATEHLIRTPLRRPFTGQGAMFRLAVRDTAAPNGQTVFSRRARLEVQESAIMRFLGSLASHAIGDLDVKVEAEEDRFLRDGFAALLADLRAARPGTGRPES